MCRRLNVERLERSGGYHSEHDGVLSEASAEGLPGTRDKVFSATMLETYRKCPMSYFLRYVLYLRPLEGDDDSEALRVGNAAHRILFRFYRDRLAQGKGMPSLAENMDEVKEDMRRIGDEVRKEFPMDSAESEAFFRSLVGDGGTNGTLGRFIEQQASKDRPRWSPGYLEYGFGSRFSAERNDASSTESPAIIPLSEDQNLLLRGKVDRVDVKDDRFLIIDYKTGEAPSYVSVSRGYSMQMPLYLMACEQLLGKKPAGAAYYQLKNDDRFGMQLRIGSPAHRDELGGTPDAYKNGQTGDLEICRSNVREVLDGISSAVFHPVDSGEKERCPSYCPYVRICRKDEMRVMMMSRSQGVE
jgi:ATP-dependent helicase/nuclease subunit B